MGTVRMFRRRNRLTHAQWAVTVAVRAEGLLLRDNVERAGEPGSGGHGATRLKHRVASGHMGRTNPRTTTKGRAIAQDETTPVPGACRDAAAWLPLSSCCIGSGALAMSAPALSVSAFALSVSAGACWQPHRRALAGRGLLAREVSPTGAPRPSCCCAPLGARVKS